jgi:hypothetical protein
MANIVQNGKFEVVSAVASIVVLSVVGVIQLQ